MRFELPLKVFLSYSHGDDPRLFLEFLNHLKALSDDRIIKRWCDRNIDVGDNWDDVINEKLHDCQLFVALTSANFNASDYISGKEMAVAWERHERRECRIIPILWKEWHLPERWRSLQFVPSNSEDVVNSQNTDKALRLITTKIENAAKDMTKGVWATRDAKVTVASPELPYLCDWTTPLQELRKLGNAGDRDLPRLLTLAGRENDCTNSFMTRVHRRDLPGILGLPQGPMPDIRPMDWPSDASKATGNLHFALEAEPDWPIDQKVPEGINIIKTITEGWDAHRGDVLLSLLEELSQPRWSMSSNRCLLIVVCALNSGWIKGNDAICRQVQMAAGRVSAIRSVAIPLPKIERQHALNWASRPEVSRIHGGRDEEVMEEIKDVYGWWRKTMRMKPLATELLRIVNKNGAVS